MLAAVPFVALTALAVVALLVAEARDSRPGVWIAKPLASTGFVAYALAAGALATGYGQVVVVALVLCWLGDVLLIPRGARGWFLAGLGAFLLGHLAFAVGFAGLGLAPGWLVAAALPAGLLAAGVLRWLWPHVGGSMRGPVIAYVAVICAMVALAAGAVGAGAPPVLLAGAVSFLVSDLAVARQRFVARSLTNKLWGLLLYYAGVLGLAARAV